VTIAKTDSEIVELVLASFQKDLARFGRRWFSRLIFRAPAKPSIGYVEQYSATDEKGDMVGPVLGVWRITPEIVERLPVDFRLPEPSSISSNRYDCTFFSFTLPDLSGLGVASSVSGPRCGIGYRYRIGIDGIEMAEGLWIS
jgi:hypothetical protein